MVTGLINSGISLGAMTGPLLSGIIIDALSYVWTLTILAFAYLLMVSNFLQITICLSFNTEVATEGCNFRQLIVTHQCVCLLLGIEKLK